MRALFISLPAILLLAACEPDKPHWENVCVRSESFTMLMPITFDGKTFQMMPQVQVVCVARQTTCVIPNEWKGEAKCPPINQEEVVNEQ